MSNFFTRMAERVLGLASLVDPAPRSQIPTADEQGWDEEEHAQFWIVSRMHSLLNRFEAWDVACSELTAVAQEAAGAGHRSDREPR